MTCPLGQQIQMSRRTCWRRERLCPFAVAAGVRAVVGAPAHTVSHGQDRPLAAGGAQQEEGYALLKERNGAIGAQGGADREGHRRQPGDG